MSSRIHDTVGRFDPYRDILRIDYRGTSPTYCELLGIPPGHERQLMQADELSGQEKDYVDDQFEMRADFLRRRQNGPHTDAVQQLLNEISKARIVLLDDRRRRQARSDFPPPVAEEEDDDASVFDSSEAAGESESHLNYEHAADTATGASPSSTSIEQDSASPAAGAPVIEIQSDPSPAEKPTSRDRIAKVQGKWPPSQQTMILASVGGGVLLLAVMVGTILSTLGTSAENSKSAEVRQGKPQRKHKDTSGGKPVPPGQLLLLWSDEERPGAKLRINQRTVDPASAEARTAGFLRFQLPAGRYFIRIDWSDAHPFQEIVTLPGGDERRVQVVRWTGPAHAPRDAFVFQGHAYKLYTERVSWHDARRRCESLGGHLICIESEEEQKFFASIIGRRRCWLGATDEQQEGEWRWINGNEMSYTHWDPGEPSNSRRRQHYLCTHDNDEHTWDDVGRRARLPFVCEWEPLIRRLPETAQPEPTESASPTPDEDTEPKSDETASKDPEPDVRPAKPAHINVPADEVEVQRTKLRELFKKAYSDARLGRAGAATILVKNLIDLARREESAISHPLRKAAWEEAFEVLLLANDFDAAYGRILQFEAESPYFTEEDLARLVQRLLANLQQSDSEPSATAALLETMLSDGRLSRDEAHAIELAVLRRRIDRPGLDQRLQPAKALLQLAEKIAIHADEEVDFATAENIRKKAHASMAYADAELRGQFYDHMELVKTRIAQERARFDVMEALKAEPDDPRAHALLTLYYLNLHGRIDADHLAASNLDLRNALPEMPGKPKSLYKQAELLRDSPRRLKLTDRARRVLFELALQKYQRALAAAKEESVTQDQRLSGVEYFGAQKAVKEIEKELGIEQTPVSTAMKLSGQQYVRTNLKYDGLRPLLVEVEIILDHHNKVGSILGNAQYSGFNIEIRNGKIQFAFHDARDYQVARWDETPPLGEKIHIAATYNGRQAILYINGNAVSAARVEGRHKASKFPVFIGADPNRRGGPQRRFNGAIDRVHLAYALRGRDWKPFQTMRGSVLLLNPERNEDNQVVNQIDRLRIGITGEPTWIDLKPTNVQK